LLARCEASPMSDFERWYQCYRANSTSRVRATNRMACPLRLGREPGADEDDSHQCNRTAKTVDQNVGSCSRFAIVCSNWGNPHRNYGR
jgi:hypothetical protein